MALTEALRFLITSDSAQARSDLSRLSQQTGTAMSSIDKLKGAFSAGLGIGAGAGAVDGALAALSSIGRVAVAQIGSAVDASSRLQQAQGAVQAIFRDSASEVREFAAGAAESVGLSSAAFQQQAATIGALLQNLGQTRAESARTATDLIEIGADLAATFGGTTADAVAAIGSALRGERDPIERYGVSIKEAAVQQKALELGLASTAAELNDQTKATATLALIQEQASSTTGAFARESDTLAGQQQRFAAEVENLRAELGQALLPAMTELVEISRDALPVIEALGGGVAAAAESFAQGARFVASFAEEAELAANVVFPFASQSADALGRLFDFGSGGKLGAIEQIGGLAEAVRDGKVEIEAVLPALSAMPPAVRAFALELVGLRDQAEAVSPSLATLQKQASGLFGTLFAVDQAQAGFLRATERAGGSAGRTGKQIETAYRAIDDATRSLADAQGELADAEMQRFLTSLGADADTITLAQIAERDSTRGLADAKRDLIDAQERLRALREGDEASLLDAEAANIEAQRRLVEAESVGDAVALKRARADLLRSEEALAEARNPGTAEELAEAEQDVAEAQDRVTRAEVDARRAREELNRVVNIGKDGSKELVDANKAVEQAQRRVEQAERALTDANDALNTSTGSLGGTVRSASDQFLSGVSAADGWLQKLISGKATPEEFAAAVGTVRDRLGDVAAQAGQTEALDEYLRRMQALYDEIRRVDNAASNVSIKLRDIPGLVGSSGGIGVGAGVSQTVTLNVDGRRFGEVVVNGLISWQDANGAIPIRVR